MWCMMNVMQRMMSAAHKAGGRTWPPVRRSTQSGGQARSAAGRGACCAGPLQSNPTVPHLVAEGGTALGVAVVPFNHCVDGGQQLQAPVAGTHRARGHSHPRRADGLPDAVWCAAGAQLAAWRCTAGCLAVHSWLPGGAQLAAWRCTAGCLAVHSWLPGGGVLQATGCLTGVHEGVREEEGHALGGARHGIKEAASVLDRRAVMVLVLVMVMVMVMDGLNAM